MGVELLGAHLWAGFSSRFSEIEERQLNAALQPFISNSCCGFHSRSVNAKHRRALAATVPHGRCVERHGFVRTIIRARVLGAFGAGFHPGFKQIDEGLTIIALLSARRLRVVFKKVCTHDSL